jgi:hypothetical protein
MCVLWTWKPDPSSRVGLQPFAFWDWGFDSRRGMDPLSLLICHVEVSASGWLPVQRNLPNVVCLECDCVVSTVRRPWPKRGCRVMEKRNPIKSVKRRELMTGHEQEWTDIEISSYFENLMDYRSIGTKCAFQLLVNLRFSFSELVSII